MEISATLESKNEVTMWKSIKICFKTLLSKWVSSLIRALGRENKQCYGLKASVTVILDRIGLPWSISLSVVLWQFARFYFGTMSNTRTYGITLKYCVHLRKKVEFLGVGEYCFVVVTNKKGKKVPWFKFVNVTTPFVCSYTFFKCSN